MESFELASIKFRLEDASVPPNQRSSGSADHEDETAKGTGVGCEYLLAFDDTGRFYEGIVSKFEGRERRLVKVSRFHRFGNHLFLDPLNLRLMKYFKAPHSPRV